jgi:hypothetical protein
VVAGSNSSHGLFFIAAARATGRNARGGAGYVNHLDAAATERYLKNAWVIV